MQTDRYLPDEAWTDLSNYIAARPALCRGLGITSNPNTGRPGWDELIDVLGGQFGIFPERFREVLAAEDARQDDEAIFSPLGLDVLRNGN